MKLIEILDQAKLLVAPDADTTDELLISKVNQIIRRLYRKFPLPSKIYKFNTTTLPYYDLPFDCAEDRIKGVVIDDQEYKKVDSEDQDPPDTFCAVIAGKLFIHPNPTEVKEAFLYYGQRINELTTDSLGATPSIAEDYHEILVYELAKWMAGIQKDVDMVNNLQAEVDEITKEATRKLKKMGQKKVKITVFW